MAGAVEDFLKTVVRSGLLDRAELSETLRGAPSEGREDPKALAEHLVQQGKLSRFQAYKLLQGASLGLQLGPYHIQTPIGRGGMGTVYLARDTRTGQHVAIKVLPPRLATEKSHYLARFQREMELSTKVIHPNIALTHEVGVHKGVYFIAMEYIPGRSMHRLVSKEGPLPVARVARLFAEVAEALQHAHEMNLIHRDLKPSNIMITPNDHAKVLDLGLAMYEGENTEPLEVIGGRGYVVGSLDFMAPEQTEDPLAVDARADLYAMGCSMYFALTGQPPFPEGGRKDKIQGHRYLDPRPVRELNPAVHERFAELVDRLMAKNPARRHPTARAARQDLLAWTGEETARPMDRRDDATYQEAVHALEQAPVSQDSLGEEPILPMESPSSVKVAKAMILGEWWWVLGGVAGFWVVLLVFLVVLRLVR